ncbi:MAG TPA: efflux RND transporter periplasmic adaptor subunit [Pseudonocardia sp.]|nr:efflux RND transporter periplasmic adaptor subunit [Pseudonocardia sp.]
MSSPNAEEKPGGQSTTASARPESTPPASTRKPKRTKRRVTIVLAIIVALAAIGLGTWYFINSSKYVSTDNAQVDGDKIDINAPNTGTLTAWEIDEGSTVRTNQVVGRIQILNSFAQPQMTIKSPGNGTVAVNNVVNGAYVTSGTELATAYDFSKIYITARIDETDIADVHVGAPVDIDVDAFSGTPVTGIVQDVQGSSAGTFSLFPQNNTSGNFQKVTQVIPVKISLTNTSGKQLVPGMNVTVHIHKTQD